MLLYARRGGGWPEGEPQTAGPDRRRRDLAWMRPLPLAVVLPLHHESRLWSGTDGGVSQIHPDGGLARLGFDGWGLAHPKFRLRLPSIRRQPPPPSERGGEGGSVSSPSNSPLRSPTAHDSQTMRWACVTFAMTGTSSSRSSSTGPPLILAACLQHSDVPHGSDGGTRYGRARL